MKIALLAGGVNWAGAMEQLRVLLSGLTEASRQSGSHIYILLPKAGSSQPVIRLLQRLKSSVQASWQQRRLVVVPIHFRQSQAILDFLTNIDEFNATIQFYPNSPEGLRSTLLGIKADVALPLFEPPGASVPCPWVGLIFDLQHRFLHHNFTANDCFDRDIQQASLLKAAKTTIAISSEAKRTILEQYPWADSASIFPLPFTPHARSSWLQPDPAPDLSDYHLPDRYFIISNQFWLHKDHLTAFRAFRVLLDQLPDPQLGLVCTGSTNDYRHVNHIKDIHDYLASAGLSVRVRLLGHIPKDDQVAIMKQSIALIQPTTFEGTAGGLCVNDAVSLGVPVILSDLPVNREATGANLSFFPVGDHHCLAQLLLSHVLSPPPRPTSAELQSIGRVNRQSLATFLNSVIDASLAPAA